MIPVGIVVYLCALLITHIKADLDISGNTVKKGVKIK